MPSRIIALSGPICSGKTELGDGLIGRFGVVRVKTREVVQRLLGTQPERKSLQAAGERLDERTPRGQWVADAVARQASRLPVNAIILVDAVRIKGQVDCLRRAFGSKVTHIHLEAPADELERRYTQRKRSLKELKSYRLARRNKTEKQVDSLAQSADVVIDTFRNAPHDVVVRVASHLGLYGRGTDRLVDVLVGGQYGSEGKGQLAAYLAREYSVLVRVGGPNAGHTVYGAPPRTYRHIPSGTDRAEDAKVVLGPGAVLWLPTLMKEIIESGLTPDRLFIDPQAMMINQADINFEERKLRDTIGSTAKGIGCATARKVLRESWRPPVKLARHTPQLKEYLAESTQVFEGAFARGERILLEGTQGTGLSLHHGSYPHVTSRDTTVSGCLAEAGIAPTRVRRIVMACRSYPIRVQNPQHGTSGYMSHAISWAEVARRCDYSAAKLRRAERTSTTNLRRRVAEFDWALFRRSVSLNGPTDIALTFADYIGSGNQHARRFGRLNTQTIEFIQEMERVASAPVSLIATRFHYRSIIDRRDW